MMDDDDIRAEVERLKAKWIDGAPKRTNLDDEERIIAARLLGSSSEAKRLAETRTGERYRYRRPVVTAHFGFHQGMLGNSMWASTIWPYWYIEIFKNGKKYEFFRGERGECLTIVYRLERMGIKTSRVGRDPRDSATPIEEPSRRARMLDKAGRFRR